MKINPRNSFSTSVDKEDDMTQQIFNLLIEFLEEDQWDFQWVSGMSILNMSFAGKSGSWACYIQAREHEQQVVFYSVLPIRVPVEKRQIAAEFITRANYGMVIGNFEMDYEDGEVRFKTSIDVEGYELMAPMIRQLIYSNLVITDRYMPGVMRVIYSDSSPVEILEEIEDQDQYDYEDEDYEDDEDDGGDEDDYDDLDEPPDDRSILN
jgi:hypothetical protein